jgi:glycosyltransferase involved in cell wall biosynthesis
VFPLSLINILFNLQINLLLIFFKMTITNFNDPYIVCREQFELLHVCVIIPTYNNDTCLAAVIADIAQFTNHIIVVNDGSTDSTQSVIESFSVVQSVSYTPNAGKGRALRKAFAYAIEKGYQYAITIDSDGQHFAKDLPAFIDKLLIEKNAIIIGARNMNQASVPGGSSFGNRFSNFWFRVETGISLSDTQSGYRLYPLEAIKKMRFFTCKYEFEIEVLVRAAWKGVNVVSVPVTVYYPPKEERVSHFRPYKDFFRISVLNTILVLITFFYIKPRNLLRSIFIKKKFKQLLNDHLFNTHDSARLKAFSIAFGVFMGIIPIWGFQLITAIFLAILFKLNKPLVIIAANISIPPMLPVIIFASYKAGAFWMGNNAMHIDFNRTISLDSVKKNLQQYIYGSITLAILAGIFFGVLIFILLKLFNKKSILAR